MELTIVDVGAMVFLGVITSGFIVSAAIDNLTKEIRRIAELLRDQR